MNTAFSKLTINKLESMLEALDNAQSCSHKEKQSAAFLAYGVKFNQTNKKYFEPADFKDRELSTATLCENIAHILFTEQKDFLKKHCPDNLYEFELSVGKLQLVDIELSGCEICEDAIGIIYADKIEHYTISTNTKYTLMKVAKELGIPLTKRTNRCVI